MMKKGSPFYTEAQFKNEIAKCEACEKKPCKTACPADCSPADFIMAAAGCRPSDFERSTAVIMGSNPFGGICGMVCPDRFCMSGCSHKDFDAPLNIPDIQAKIVARANELKRMPVFLTPKPNGRKVAIVGAGPAGIAAAGFLVQNGYEVDIFDRGTVAGGACNLIPDFRLPKDVLKTDIDFTLGLGNIQMHLRTEIQDPESLLKKGYEAVIVAVGLWNPIQLGIKNENLAVAGLAYLQDPKKYSVKGARVVVVGGGATAADCALTAKERGAAAVEMYSLETIGEMPLTNKEMRELIAAKIGVNGRTQLTSIVGSKGKISGIEVQKVELKGVVFNLKNIHSVPGTGVRIKGVTKVIIAIGARSGAPKTQNPRVFFAGDCVRGPTTVVEAVADGKNIARQVKAVIEKEKNGKPAFADKIKSVVVIPGFNPMPVPLTTDFFGRKLPTPFLLSAAPPSDGLEQMIKAYEAGWAGGIMKTAFDGLPIHIPAEYMFMFNESTYANCDNVSDHTIDRVSKEVRELVKRFPDRLTAASTGGPVTGNDESDRKGWQSNTKKLEAAGCMAIEYSLSCPQGGDGTEGDIVSQNAALTARIIDWVMECGDPNVPKLFKLTGAVTSIIPIINSIKKVFEKYPKKKSGVTLANTFPTLGFRPGERKNWEEGVVVGMSGEGALPISYLTLSNVIHSGVYISGNGGPMDYKGAADFLALGASSVQFCTIVMKYGYGIHADLCAGLSHLMKDRGVRSVKDLTGLLRPNPIRGFMELSPVKKVSQVDKDLCEHCGNCGRCPYLAITYNKDHIPSTDPALCIGCSICVQKCFAGALYMRERKAGEERAE